jgi:ParB-like chromosome segregation protein Spo0J
MTKPEAMQPHPAAEIFPLMGGADFDALVADIRENGQREPIILHDGLILDGRNRARACEVLGIAPLTVQWDGKGAPETFVISKNLHRRHLSESQRASIAARYANRGEGRPSKKTSSIELVNQESAAKLLNVSVASVKRAAAVIERAEPELVAAVERGDIPVSTAAKLVDLPKARQREIAKSGKKAAAKSAQQIETRKRARRAQKPTPIPVVKETEHDRDLRYLRETWATTCESARTAFAAEIGFRLRIVA